jgi:hypothetical protein
VGAPQRPWAALLAAGLVVAVLGVGLFAASPAPLRPGGAPAGSMAATAAATMTMGTATSTPIPLGGDVPAGSCAPRTADLAAWWPGDDGGAELVGGRAATLQAGATTGPGLVGQAIEFDGRTGHATVALDPALRLGTADLTLMLWVRFDRTTGEQVLLEQWRDPVPGVPSAGWTFTKRADNSMLFTSGSNGFAEGAETPPLAFDPGRWHHLAVWRSASAMKIYVDGQPIGVGGIAGSQIDIGVDLPLFMGRRGDDRGFHLAGALDEIQLTIGRALTESEIRASYLAGSTGTCAQSGAFDTPGGSP